MIQSKEHNRKEFGGTDVTGVSRREFMRDIALSSGGAITFGAWLVEEAEAQGPPGMGGPRYGLVIVDFDKCTGCRTCESVCANANHTVEVNGETLPDLGNPAHSRIRVEVFHPPVDIPNRCCQCDDAPCVEACPVSPDPTTGRKALYRDENTQAVKVDYDRCIACGSCARACESMRTGIIMLNPTTNQPEGICSLCEGDPQCVKYCPFGALSYSQGGVMSRHYAMNPEKLAAMLTAHYYYEQD